MQNFLSLIISYSKKYYDVFLAKFPILSWAKKITPDFFKPLFPFILLLVIVGFLYILYDLIVFFINGTYDPVKIHHLFNVLSPYPVWVVFLIVALGMAILIALINIGYFTAKYFPTLKNTNLHGYIIFEYDKPSFIIRAFMFFVGIIFFSFIIWASQSHVDIYVNATGKIVPKGKVKPIKVSEQGIIKFINVEEGKPVKKGDIIFKLDHEDSTIDKDKIQKQIYMLEIEHIAIKKLLNIDVSENHKTIAQQSISFSKIQDNYILSEKKKHNATLAVFDDDYKAILLRIKKSTVTLKKLLDTLPIIQQRLENKKMIYQKGHGKLEDVHVIDEQYRNHKNDIEIEKLNIDELQQTLTSTLTKKKQAKANYRYDLTVKLRDIEKELHTLYIEIPQIEYRTKNKIFIAPIDGIAEQITILSEGQAVQSGEQLMVIVPKDQGLVFEANVLSKDVGFLYGGQEADIRIDAYQFTKYGSIKGHIENIAEDSIDDEALGVVRSIKVSLSRNNILVKGEEKNLFSGMTGTIAFKTGVRTILEFLISPLLRYKEEAFREQ